MRNLIKSQLYQMKKSTLPLTLFIALIVMAVVQYFGEINYQRQSLSAGKYLADNGAAVLFVAIIFGICFTGYICGMDFTDKTTNYELMSGHTRGQVYFARAILSIIGGTLGTLLVILVPVIFGIAAYGWGSEITVKDTVIRLILVSIVTMRIICEFVFFTYVLKTPYFTMGLAYVIFMFGFAMQAFSNKTSVFLGITSLNRLAEFESWMTYTLDDTVNTIKVYDAALSGGDIAGIMLSSICIGALFLWLGYRFFSNDDLN